MKERGHFTVAFVTNPNAGVKSGLVQGFDLVFESRALLQFMMARGLGKRRFTSSGNPSGTGEYIAAYFRSLSPRNAGVLPASGGRLYRLEYAEP